MEIGLLDDDRKPGSSNSTYQNLTPNGKALFDILQKHISEMPDDFFEFRTDSKVELSWAMVREADFNKFFREVLCSDESDKRKLLDIFLGFMAIKHMCKYLFHVSQKKIVNRADLYRDYFKTPFIESYFERYGIVQDSEAGAKRRLPFLINILEACGIVSFVNMSSFQLEKMPLIPELFSEDIEETDKADSYIKIAENFYQGKRDEIDMDSEEIVQMKTWFGKDFLTDRYFIDEIMKVDGSS